ncbi:5-amino-6-(5-phosphoribosylamino)uracil reductase [Angomonas deanei]|uniref:RibD C-terminal domain containing protein n=1 Tax=Angomonas deanei TaxID=59799 RepID=A0A7G2C660_9TRYP|nr:5-amino-6-(5-phosphoribosylamino)uracil reductase [Angomonas deanei]CAD2215196.1 hypothetical protein, conserved [Angomonas deanei]|eukprot:EPY17750.1 5-amino-6-(5-phosphoribosylamino)uracil reductase [Angomonas deanei]
MDSKGTVASKTNVVEMKGSGYNYFDGDRIVEVVSKNGVSDSFLTHLRKVGIPYIFAGEDSVDSGVAFHKMCECLGEKQGFVFGGATLNGSFLKQGLVTDVSLLQVPAFSNNDKDLPLFNPTEGKFPPLFLNLVASESVGRGGTWLHYALDKKE